MQIHRQNLKAIFLDRDGTIIVDKVYLNDPNQIEYLPGAVEGMRLLKDAGFVFLVVTNQSGIARGIVEIKNLDAIHAKMSEDLARSGIFIKGYYYSPYSVESNHPTRKPNPGMLINGRNDHGIDMRRSWMMGDRMIDVEAGHRAGCRSILLGNLETPSLAPQFAPPEGQFPSIIEAAHFILSQSETR